MPNRSKYTRRTYHFTSVIGQGGFGRVYRASMEGSDGFRKEVAVKLMHEENMPEGALVRFGDEARILGLIRDRAIVSVDSPTRLNGRLAVVMEYVEGASAAELLKNGAFPATVALEIVQEVARVLDKVVRHPGPDGRPLNLLHRDLKPANLQITPGGEVKVLDFGIARATFDAREAHTTNVAGTPGYMAPERLSGVEGPAGDIYSLGVVLQVLVTREKAIAHGVFRPRRNRNGKTSRKPVERTPVVLATLALAQEMWNIEPSARPTARQVEDRCRQLHQEFGGANLRRWAETHVSASPPLEPDELVGVTLTEMIEEETRFPLALLPRSVVALVRSRRVLVMGALLVATLVAAGIASAGLGGGLGLMLSSKWPADLWPDRTTVAASAPPPVRIREPITGPEPVVRASVRIGPAPAPAANPMVEPLSIVSSAPVVSSPAIAAPVLSSPVLAAVFIPPPIAPSPVPSPVASAPIVHTPIAVPLVADPVPPGPVWKVTFASVPGGAMVLVDGVSIGTAPILGHELAGGTYTVKMVYPMGESIVRTIDTGSRAPSRYVWDQQGGGTWNSY